MRRVIACFVVSLAFAVPASAQMLMSVPNVCPAVTATAVGDGPWSSAATWGGVVPTASDSVVIPSGRTVTGSGDVGCVTVQGRWLFSGTWTFTSIQVEVGGVFDNHNGAAFEGIIRDAPIAAVDTQQYGNGIVVDGGRAHWTGPARTTWLEHEDIAAGATTLTMRGAPVNWQPGERLVVFDTRRGNNCSVGCTRGAQREVKTIASVSGSTVTVTTPFAYAHTSAGSQYPSADGTLKRIYPWATHLGGQRIFRSQNPNGVRGHIIAIAHSDFWAENVTLYDLGRTPLNGGVIGRYVLHLHHLIGPATPQANGRQFTVKGVEFAGGRKWGITIHKSSYGLIEDNAGYDVPGAHFYFEDGDEIENVMQRNSAVFGIGNGGREGNTGGFGFYMRGVENYIRDNRSANHFADFTETAYGFKYFPKYLGNVIVPAAQGQMPSVSVNSYLRPIKEFSGNTCFADENCFTFWWVGTLPGYQYATARSTVRNLTFARIPEKGVFQYEASAMTVDGLVGRDGGRAWVGQDYQFRNGIIRNVDLQGFNTGLELSSWTQNTEVLLENLRLANTTNIQFFLHWSSATVAPTDGTTRRIRNATFLTGKDFSWYVSTGSRNYVSKQLTFIEAYNGNPADNFQLFAPGAAPTAVLPQHAPVGCVPGSWTGNGCSRIGSPVAGQTNAQNFAARGLWYMGQQLCASPQTSSAFDGFACRTGAPPPPPPPPPCTFTVSPLAIQAPAAGGPFAVTVTASASTCGWSAVSSQPWITVAPTTSTGSGSVSIAVAANTAQTARSATLNVAGAAVTVAQAAAPPPPVDCVVSPWSVWGVCDATTRTQTRSRTVLTPAQNGGAVCPVLVETQACIPPDLPPTGAFAGLSTAVTYTVTAADDIGVARVDLVLNGVVVQSRTAGPYVFTVVVPLPPYIAEARIVDTAGQVTVVSLPTR
jgi:hypothetical protein